MKPLSDYQRHSGIKSGLQPKCRACINQQSKDWYEKNKARKAEAVAEWRASNKEKFKQIQQAYRQAKPECGRASTKKWQQANPGKRNAYKRAYRHQNPEAVARHEIRRRTAEQQAMPSWTDPRLIADLYRLSKIATAETGYSFVVDHIVPLRSKLVCGLHAASNLTVVLRKDNERKSNHWWPDMPERAPSFEQLSGRD